MFYEDLTDDERDNFVNYLIDHNEFDKEATKMGFRKFFDRCGLIDQTKMIDYGNFHNTDSDIEEYEETDKFVNR